MIKATLNYVIEKMTAMIPPYLHVITRGINKFDNNKENIFGKGEVLIITGPTKKGAYGRFSRKLFLVTEVPYKKDEHCRSYACFV